MVYELPVFLGAFGNGQVLRSPDSLAHAVQDIVRNGVSVIGSFPQFFEGCHGFIGFWVIVLLIVIQIEFTLMARF